MELSPMSNYQTLIQSSRFCSTEQSSSSFLRNLHFSKKKTSFGYPPPSFLKLTSIMDSPLDLRQQLRPTRWVQPQTRRFRLLVSLVLPKE